MEATTVPPSSASPSEGILLMALDLSKATWVVAVAPPTSDRISPLFRVQGRRCRRLLD